MNLRSYRERAGVFVISISDGWCEYSFELQAGGHFSIQDIKDRIVKHFPNKDHNKNQPLLLKHFLNTQND